MIIPEINPYIRLTMYSTLLAPSQIKRRIILDYELIYIEDGRFRLMYNNQDYLCKKGDILFLCPNIPHSFHVFETDVVQPHIHFDMQYALDSRDVFVCFQDYPQLTSQECALIRENVFPSLRNSSPILTIKNKKTFLKLFYEIIFAKQASVLNTLKYKAKMLALINDIISDNAPNDFISMGDDTRIAPLIKTYIDSNYDQNIQLLSLEQQFGYSKFYIEKLFKQEYGMSPISYCNKKRLLKATSLLSSHSVTSTAQELGYSSVYAFSRAFRSFYGSSPTKYMKTIQFQTNKEI